MKKYWLTGVSGTGKTTIGAELTKRGHYVIDVEETEGLCAWWSNESNKFVDFPDVVTANFSATHQWRLNIDKLKKMIDIRQPSVIVVGMNDTLKENLSVFEKVFILRCNPDVFIRRLKTRDNNDFGKDESMQQNILSWYEKYEAKMVGTGAISIDASQSVADVVNQIDQQLS